MITQRIVQSLPAIADICRRYGVTRLDAFGSVTRSDFDPQRSDIDLIACFEDETAAGLFDRYFGVAESLANLFHRPVDLLTERMIRNPHFREAVEAERQTLYALEHPEAAR